MPLNVAPRKTRDFSIASQAYQATVTLLDRVNTNLGQQHSSDAPTLTGSTLASSLEQCFACIP